MSVRSVEVEEPVAAGRWAGVEPARGRILEAAMRLFAREGYFRTSLPDIRRAAGVSVGAIYHHFAGKEDLAGAVYDAVLATIDGLFRSSLAGDGDFWARYRALVEGLFRLTAEEPDLIAYALHVKHRDFSAEIGPVCSSEPFVHLQERVADAMAAGDIRSGDVVVTTATLMGPPIRLMELHRDGLLPSGLEGSLDTLVDNARRALAS